MATNRSSNKLSAPKRPKLSDKIKNCANCGKIFAATKTETLCRDCKHIEEEKEREVLDYVRDNQGASIPEVCEAMDVTEKFIKNMINKGMFANIERQDLKYPCASCGKPITHDTYCSDCLAKLRAETKKIADQLAVKAAAKYGIETKKPIEKLSTIEKLDIQAASELENQNKRSRTFSKSMYENIVSKRDGRTVGKVRKSQMGDN